MEILNLLKRLEKMVPDKFPRKLLTEYEQGKLAGKIELIDFIRSLTENKQ